MRRFSIALLLVLSLFSASDAQAFRLGDSTVVIPIIGRFPGAGGTQWRTDVFLSNHYTPETTVTLRFYYGGGAVQTTTITVGAYSTVTLSDIVLNTFGRETAAGPLEMSVPFTIDARARIYNAGNPAGQFGQSVPGIGLGQLTRQAFLYGLSGINGNRLNIGVTNPNDVEVTVAIRVRDKNNALLHSRDITLAPHSNIQYNDIFPNFVMAPQDGVQVDMNTPEHRIYGYASEVRNDTGDAVFVFGLSPNT